MPNKTHIYEFLAGYKHNSGIYVNNFFRGRDYKTYCADKFHEFSFSFGCFPPNHFNDMMLSISMVEYLGKSEDHKVAYFPIDCAFLERLIAVSEAFDEYKLPRDTIVWRGCNTIERNGVTGVVSVTTDKKIAQQFSRGTLIKAHLPANIGNLDIGKLRRGLGVQKDTENEMLIPPCDYEIINSEMQKPGLEPNNKTGKTQFYEIRVKPKDMLAEFLHAMKNPPREYLPIRHAQGMEYAEALDMLCNYINGRAKGAVPAKSHTSINDDDIRRLANGNPGAIIALTELMGMLGGREAIAVLKQKGIKGPDIYVLWSDKCQRNAHKMKELLHNMR
ncbi:MAG: hypothetical protein FWE64_04040 [Alphaproteobacteria bacterium]|nr:hypothetical protein [Alphaproteobacteria bacterium]